MSVGSLQVYCSLMVLDLHPFQSVRTWFSGFKRVGVCRVWRGARVVGREGGKGVGWREGSKSS